MRQQETKTNVLASQTSKKSQIAMLTLAAALYGLTRAPGTGPPPLPAGGI